MSDKVKMLEGGSFKFDETTRYIKFEFVDDDNEPFTPLPQHSYIARIGNSTGYLGDYPVAISGHAFILSSEKLIDLGPGNYELEIWEFYQDNQGNKQTTIYPSPDSTVLFSITKNITSSTGEQIEKISFEKLVDQITKNVQLNVKALQGYSKAEMDSKLQNYVTKDQIPDTSNFVTNEQLPEVQLDIDRRTITINGNTIGIPNSVDLSAYAKKNEVPAITYDPDTKSLTINGTKVELPGNVDLSNYYTKSEVDNRIAQAATDDKVDLTGYLTKTDAIKTYATKSELPDLTDYAKMSDLPSITDLVKKSELANYATKDDLKTVTSNANRRAPMGYTLDRTTNPWTIWFDNGCGLQFPNYATNAIIYGYGFSTNEQNTNLIMYPLTSVVMSASHGALTLDVISKKTDGFEYWGPNTKVINPIRTDAGDYDWSNVYFNDESRAKKGQNYTDRQRVMLRVMYELGIWSIDDIKPFGLIKKEG